MERKDRIGVAREKRRHASDRSAAPEPKTGIILEKDLLNTEAKGGKPSKRPKEGGKGLEESVFDSANTLSFKGRLSRTSRGDSEGGKIATDEGATSGNYGCTGKLTITGRGMSKVREKIEKSRI